MRIGLAGSVRDEVFVKFPCAVRGLGVVGPLLVHVGARIGENAMVELGVIPGHDQGAGAAGTATHRGAAVGVFGELDVGLRLDERENLGLDELGVAAGHGVVFEAAFAALGVASAIADGDGDHDRHFVLGDQIIQGGEQKTVRAVGADDEWRGRSGDILFWDVDRYFASVGSGVAGGEDEFGGIGRIWRAKGAGIARDAWIKLAVGRVHGELDNRSLWHSWLRRHFRRGVVSGAEDEVSIGVRGREARRRAIPSPVT